jgi:Dolichyl-phosphate-mannose-protein mannosyltransferase
VQGAREPTEGNPAALAAHRDPFFWAVLASAALLLFRSLDGRYLWQDEAETALLAKNVLKYGVPIAHDGTNVVSQEAGREFAPDSRWRPFLWRWSPWTQFYVAAASFKFLGPTTLAARLPFALLGLLTVPLTYALARRLFGSLGVARLSALFLSLSVPFLLHARQARWCALAYLLVVLLLLCLLGLRRGSRGALAGCVASAALLFYTNYFVAVGVLLALLGAAPLLSCERPFVKRLLAACFAIAALTFPGLAFFEVLGKQGELSRGKVLGQLLACQGMYLTFLLPLPALALLAWVLLTERAGRLAAGWRRGVSFLLAFSLLYTLYLSLAPWLFFRYLTILLPVAAVLLGLAADWVFARSRVLGAAALLTLLLTDYLHQVPLGLLEAPGTAVADRFPFGQPVSSPLSGYLYELTHPFDSPEQVLAEHLRKHAKATDVVLTTYDDLPLQFYTGLRVAGGLQGQPLPPEPDWVIRRHLILSGQPGKDMDVARFIEGHIDRTQYEEVILPQKDYMLGHDPDPHHHLFRAPPKGPPFFILKKKGRGP